jgi:hypothetical protein
MPRVFSALLKGKLGSARRLLGRRPTRSDQHKHFQLALLNYLRAMEDPNDPRGLRMPQESSRDPGRILERRCEIEAGPTL